ncbi:MAG: hypothetical protein J7M17_01630, partial [Anaerolineae bacterium]|nr:hypothetical protein [Anaerolineae bacterium]
RTSSQQEIWSPAVNSLCDPEQRVKAVLWLEHDLPDYRPQRRKAKFSVRTKVFKQKLKWLTPQVLVCDQTTISLPELQVGNLPRH